MRPMNALLLAAALACGLMPGCGGELPPPPPIEPPVFSNLMEYRFATRFPALASQPKGLSVTAQGRILAAGAGEVVELEPDGGLVRRLAIEGDANCVAAISSGGFYVGLRQRVDAYDAAGARTHSWDKLGRGESGIGHVTSIAVSGYNVLVADALNRDVYRFDTTGDFILSLGKHASNGAPNIVTPSMYLDCATNSAGEVVIANPGRFRIEYYSLDGRLLRMWGAVGAAPDRFCPCCNPIHMAIGPRDEVITVEKGLPRVKVHDADGRLLAVLGAHSARAAGQTVADPPPSDLPVFGDVAVDAKGHIFVIYSPAAEIWVFERPEDSGASP